MNDEHLPERPTRPRLVFRVGIVGHRWDRLGVPVGQRGGASPAEATDDVERALLATCGTILREIAATVNAVADAGAGYRDRTATLVLVSGLAEGADRIAAHAALNLDYHLWAVLPFDATTYLADFDEQWKAPMWSRPGAATEFSELLSQSSERLVMDGKATGYDAYVALGRAVIHHSDVIIGIWNQATAAGAGGTANILLDARQAEIPIVRIDPAEPKRAWLEDPREPDDGVSAELSLLDRRIRALIEPPTERDLREAYFHERFVAGRLGKAYGVMSSLVGNLGAVGRYFVPTFIGWLQVLGRIFRPSWREHWVPATKARWEEEWSANDPVDAELRTRLVESLAAPYAWADNLATYYANLYRSAFTIVFSLAWVAAVVAVVGFVAYVTTCPVNHVGECEVPAVAQVASYVEVAVVVAILSLTTWGRRFRYHEKWIDYRSLAERLRHLTVVWSAGASVSFARMAEHARPADEHPTHPGPRLDDPRTSWVGWLYRATVRELGFSTREFTPAHLESCRRLLVNHEIAGQRAYHATTVGRLERIHRNLDLRARALFVMAVVVAVVHLPPLHPYVLGWLLRTLPDGAEFWVTAGLTILSVFLPARAAALNGWAGHADFYGAALRSAQIENRLRELERVIQTVTRLDSTMMGDLAIEAARAMESELLAWHTVSRSKPIPEA